ncbi:N(2)-fixation sustaining protein CowN [Corallincola platygyrae]|uniref:N(2)-fixation sustaining protein CowN n=1 Tax=Corallincola platygyrae TaxID=1193278 RepID=A0ABW4XIC3_9GAMM
MSEQTAPDRYISFCGIECDAMADELIAKLEHNISRQTGAQQWRDYFTQKRVEQQKMGRDNLHFIGNQTNPLYEYFEDCGDELATALLYQIEQECC